MAGVLQQQTIFWRPALLSVLLHALVLVATTLNWASRREPSTVARVQPRHIEARLVDASDLRPKKTEVARKPPPEVTTAVVKTPVSKPATPAPAPSKPQVNAEPKPIAKSPPKPPPGPTAEQRRAQAQQELARALEAEDIRLEQASDDQVAQSYVALISQTVQSNWSRPPSARNGMEAELVIQLIPTGEVVSVTVARSSGLLAFDRSAVNAVQKSERFPELQQLPPRVFEKSFRQFRLLFKPEDLRY